MEQKQVDITTLNVEELYKLALEQQKQITQLVAQLNQAQMNVAAIEAEIAGRSTPPAS
jgi:peptidoglycan hydrolase CwlO-like protein